MAVNLRRAAYLVAGDAVYTAGRVWRIDTVTHAGGQVRLDVTATRGAPRSSTWALPGHEDVLVYGGGAR